MSAEHSAGGSGEHAGLGGVRVCALRGGEWGDRVAASIRQRGGEPVVTPLLEVVLSHSDDLRAAVHRWQSGDYNWMVLTSVNAVQAVQGVRNTRTVKNTLAPGRIAAVGPATAAAARAAGFTVDVVPGHDFSTDGILDALSAELGDAAARVLFPVSNLADHRLQHALEAAGHKVERVTAYETVTLPQSGELRTALADRAPTVVLVTSGSAARALAHQISELPEPSEHVCVAAIGYPTAEALNRAGLRVDVMATHHTIDGLLDAVAAHLRSTSESPSTPSTPSTPGTTSGSTKESQE